MSTTRSPTIQYSARQLTSPSPAVRFVFPSLSILQHDDKNSDKDSCKVYKQVQSMLDVVSITMFRLLHNDLQHMNAVLRYQELLFT